MKTLVCTCVCVHVCVWEREDMFLGGEQCWEGGKVGEEVRSEEHWGECLLLCIVPKSTSAHSWSNLSHCPPKVYPSHLFDFGWNLSMKTFLVNSQPSATLYHSAKLIHSPWACQDIIDMVQCILRLSFVLSPLWIVLPGSISYLIL